MKLINEISDLAWEILTEACSWTSLYKNKIKPSIEVRPNRRGRYRPYKNLVVIPQWAINTYGEHYLIYYIVHELCHVFYMGHDTFFKGAEQEVLEYFGITIQYAKAYPKILAYNDKIFYTRPKNISRYMYRRARDWHLCEHCRRDIGYNQLYVTYKGKKYCEIGCMRADSECKEAYNKGETK